MRLFKKTGTFEYKGVTIDNSKFTIFDNVMELIGSVSLIGVVVFLLTLVWVNDSWVFKSLATCIILVGTVIIYVSSVWFNSNSQFKSRYHYEPDGERKKMIKELRHTWDMFPDYRLGQLMENIKPEGCKDLFYLEDDKIIELLRKYRKEHGS